MQATKTTKQRQDCRSERPQECNELDERYGKIGISAVAAAVHHKPHERKAQGNKPGHRLAPHESD